MLKIFKKTQSCGPQFQKFFRERFSQNTQNNADTSNFGGDGGGGPPHNDGGGFLGDGRPNKPQQNFQNN